MTSKGLCSRVVNVLFLLCVWLIDRLPVCFSITRYDFSDKDVVSSVLW